MEIPGCSQTTSSETVARCSAAAGGIDGSDESGAIEASGTCGGVDPREGVATPAKPNSPAPSTRALRPILLSPRACGWPCECIRLLCARPRKGVNGPGSDRNELVSRETKEAGPPVW